jgi:hypothetical protein
LDILAPWPETREFSIFDQELVNLPVRVDVEEAAAAERGRDPLYDRFRIVCDRRIGVPRSYVQQNNFLVVLMTHRDVGPSHIALTFEE